MQPTETAFNINAGNAINPIISALLTCAFYQAKTFYSHQDSIPTDQEILAEVTKMNAQIFSIMKESDTLKA